MHLSHRVAPRGVIAAAVAAGAAAVVLVGTQAEVGSPAEKVTAGDAVRRWRLEALVRAGYEPWDALILSRRPDIDLHAATDLVKHGCPSRTAVRILS